MSPRIVLDTNVIVSALMNRQGPAQRLLRLLGSASFITAISVPLVLEYEEVCKRLFERTGYTMDDIDVLLDYICSAGEQHQPDFLWRPFLKDADDDMILELAVTASCQSVVTYNPSDFKGIEVFGIKVESPVDFLRHLGELP